ncbi:alpha/beta fold hydrolase [Hoyosella altamirensis]|uniref:Poly(3-hydroxyalkanoate) depolymerase n=1 Tax=Hoyosella altamirensis TaxID=616997 RepID=A0A839RK76_9ACTN|nr:alpha/beta fold hydrolase [Hoyosella altamirensis]MBB3036709.1 poly(3-hydroxyalkanoate) depolymerase [Hoyosella altamirensis]
MITAQARPHSVRDVTVLGYAIRVAIWPGNPQSAEGNTPLLMMNGLGGRISMLTPLAESLRGVEVIAFDVPGAGDSPPPKHPYILPMLASLVRRMLTKLGYSTVDVFGLSWGGMLAQQFALQNPLRCRKLILAATMPGLPMVPGSPATLYRVSTPRRFNDPDYLRRVAGDIYGGALRSREIPVEQHAGRVSRRGYLLQQLAVTGWNSHWFMPLLRQRTLILAGNDDPIVPLVNARWMARMIPNSRLHVINDGHHFFRTSLEETRDQMLDFLLNE